MQLKIMTMTIGRSVNDRVGRSQLVSQVAKSPLGHTTEPSEMKARFHFAGEGVWERRSCDHTSPTEKRSGRIARVA